MSKDYYQILGVNKNASKEEIKKAFRKKAMELHPDKPTGDEKKFKEINEAYTVLSDDKKRAAYDQFGSNANFGGTNGGFGGFDFSQFTNQRGGSFEFDLNDILNSFFGGQGFRSFRRGDDIRIDISISFIESIKGTKKQIKFERNSGSKENLEIQIPAGIDSGEMLIVRGKGEPIDNGQPGDLYVAIHVENKTNFKKQGLHLVTKIEVSFTEALLGATKEIDNIEKGKIKINIPKNTKNGSVIKIPGRGIEISKYKKGDLLIEIEIKTPNNLSKKAKEALEILKNEGV